MRRLRRYRKPFAAGAVLALGFVANVVLAEWLANGTGKGYARAAVAEALTTTAAQPGDSLYPGGTGDLTLSVRNTNDFPVALTSVQPNGPISSSTAACGGAHGITFAGYTGNHTLPANATTEIVLADVLTMAVTSDNACQGAHFEIPVSLNGGVSAAPTNTYYSDADNDGFGDPASSTVAAQPPEGTVSDNTDCDDSDAATNPMAPEVPADGMDNDCDGAADED